MKALRARARARARVLVAAAVACAALVATTAIARAEPARARATLARVRAALETVDAPSCLGASIGDSVERARVAVVLYPDGAWALALGPPAPRRTVVPSEWEALRTCLEQQLAGPLGERLDAPPPSLSVVSRDLALTPPPAPPADTRGPKLDGTRGATCAYGQGAPVDESRVRRPVPAPCRRGLTCCFGGHPMSGGTCVAVPHGMCPPLP